jgi:predicted lipoprotein with Yx(FWY)xxD motif
MVRLSHRFVRPLAVAGALGLAGIGAHAATQAQAAPSVVSTASAHILVDARGMTLYLFSPDKHNKSVCTGDCAEYWPPAVVSKGATVPATMPGVKGTFGTTTRAGGVKQLTYDGAPFYTWIKDKKPGDMTGQGVEGIWWAVVVNTSGATSSTGATGSSTSTSSGADDHGRRGHDSTPAPTPTATGGYYHGGGDG